MIKQKTVYEVNGVEYTDYNQALAEQKKLEQQAVEDYDAEADVKRASKFYNKFLTSLSFPQIVQEGGKHGADFYLVNEVADLLVLSMKILRERYETDYYYFDEDKKFAKKIIELDNPNAAFYFLYNHRQGAEYEEIELIKPTKI